MVSSPHEPAGAVNQLAASLLTGAVVSFAFVWLDHKQAARRDQDALLLQLSFTADLSGHRLAKSGSNWHVHGR
jgi:hypothetical protein